MAGGTIAPCPPARNILYDTTKVTEAILRLRVLGNGVPVLRLDHDVIFRGNNRGVGDQGTFKAVTIAVRAYQLRMAQSPRRRRPTGAASAS